MAKTPVPKNHMTVPSSIASPLRCKGPLSAVLRSPASQRGYLTSRRGLQTILAEIRMPDTVPGSG